MSPEAVAMQRPDPLLDLWSLAVTMYESLAGSNPFRATSVAETVKLVKAAEVPDVRTVRRDCPAALAQFLALALARQPGQRPQTAAEFLSGLRGAQNLSAGQSLN
jgi:serine/threonine-protein kinase